MGMQTRSAPIHVFFMPANKDQLPHYIPHWCIVITGLIFDALTDLFAMVWILLARQSGLLAIIIAVLATITVLKVLAMPGGLLAVCALMREWPLQYLPTPLFLY